MDRKDCPNCETEKPVSEFSKRSKTYADGSVMYASWCKACVSHKVTNADYGTCVKDGCDKTAKYKGSRKCWKHHKPKKRAKSLRKSRIKRLYGITVEQYDAQAEAQDYKCAVCGVEDLSDGRRLAVDHNHDTGDVRGLLCSNCNTGIGLLQDSPEVASSAASYLKDQGVWHDTL